MATSTREIKMAGPFAGMLVILAEIRNEKPDTVLKVMLQVAMTCEAAPAADTTAPRRGNLRAVLPLDVETFLAFESWCKARGVSFTQTLEAAVLAAYRAHRAELKSHELPHPLEV